MKTPTTLIIMDGFGLRSEKNGNAVANARTPVLDKLFTQCAHTTLSASGLERRVGDKAKLAQELGIGEITLTDILKELEKPARDPREDMPAPILRSDVLDMKDLKPGMILKGTVRNVIDFGAFVDIGVHQDGLVHISQITDRFIKHPLEAVSVGDVVDVKVLDVDVAKKRISLTMRLDQEAKPKDRQKKRDGKFLPLSDFAIRTVKGRHAHNGRAGLRRVPGRWATARWVTPTSAAAGWSIRTCPGSPVPSRTAVSLRTRPTAPPCSPENKRPAPRRSPPPPDSVRSSNRSPFPSERRALFPFLPYVIPSLFRFDPGSVFPVSTIPRNPAPLQPHNFVSPAAPAVSAQNIEEAFFCPAHAEGRHARYEHAGLLFLCLFLSQRRFPSHFFCLSFGFAS